MSLIKFRNRDPWGNLVVSNFFNSDDFLDDRFWLNTIQGPAMNVKETDDHFEVELAAPGYDKKDFDVNIDNGCLNITAENSSSSEEADDNYKRREFNFSSFSKSLVLPDSVKDEKITATYKDGVLKFKLLKKEEAKNHKPKMIQIS